MKPSSLGRDTKISSGKSRFPAITNSVLSTYKMILTIQTKLETNCLSQFHTEAVIAFKGDKSFRLQKFLEFDVNSDGAYQSLI